MMNHAKIFDSIKARFSSKELHPERIHRPVDPDTHEYFMSGLADCLDLLSRLQDGVKNHSDYKKIYQYCFDKVDGLFRCYQSIGDKNDTAVTQYFKTAYERLSLLKY